LALAQVETVGLGALWCATLTCRLGAEALGFISARASSFFDSVFAATTGAGGAMGPASATVSGGGATVGGGGADVSNTTLSGHLRADWMRRIMLFVGVRGGSAAASLTGAGSGAALGQSQPATNSIASSALPTQRKYRATGTTWTDPAFVAQRNKRVLTPLFQTRDNARTIILYVLPD
jgi:hypothetical protein